MGSGIRTEQRPLAIVTAGSSGVGYELARCCARHGFDLLLASDEPRIEDAANRLRALGAQVEALQLDLSSADGVAHLAAAAGGRDVDALLANAGQPLGRSFLTQDFARVRHAIDSDLVGTADLIHRIGGRMQLRRHGRILVTALTGGTRPDDASQPIHSGTQAFIDAFSSALRSELRDSGITVTCLTFGAQAQDDPAHVARVGFQAMMNGDGDAGAALQRAPPALAPAPAAAAAAVLAVRQHRPDRSGIGER
ncbi:MAG TPA: SDR family NAD(P)-dependent oxidoreductase [Burkholderiaceae bacterium]